MTDFIGCMCGCGRVAASRGLSACCLKRLRKRIAAGETTQEKEIAAGRMRESKRISNLDNYKNFRY